jgi:hypothetical protein
MQCGGVREEEAKRSEVMPDHPAERFASLSARSQENLIAHLCIDLDVAFTFLETARIEGGSDVSHSMAAVEKARIALASVRKFQGRVENPDEWVKINDRANQLEAAINGFGLEKKDKGE